MYITFVMHLDIHDVYTYSKIYVFRKTRITYNLEWSNRHYDNGSSASIDMLHFFSIYTNGRGGGGKGN